MEQERRRMPRVPFVASAELLEVDNGTRMNAQVSELSLHGCYVDTLNPLPKGTSVYVSSDGPNCKVCRKHRIEPAPASPPPRRETSENDPTLYGMQRCMPRLRPFIAFVPIL